MIYLGLQSHVVVALESFTCTFAEEQFAKKLYYVYKPHYAEESISDIWARILRAHSFCKNKTVNAQIMLIGRLSIKLT
jgi:hypothetical protein